MTLSAEATLMAVVTADSVALVPMAAEVAAMAEETVTHTEIDKIVVVQMLPQVQAEENHKVVIKRVLMDRQMVFAGHIICTERRHGTASGHGTAHGTTT